MSTGISCFILLYSNHSNCVCMDTTIRYRRHELSKERIQRILLHNSHDITPINLQFMLRIITSLKYKNFDERVSNAVLKRAIYLRDESLVRQVINLFEVDISKVYLEYYDSILHYTIVMSTAPILKLLVEQLGDNVQDQLEINNYSLLIEAVTIGRKDIIQYLLDVYERKCVDITYNDMIYMVLFWVIFSLCIDIHNSYQYKDILEFLITDKNADINHQYDNNLGGTALPVPVNGGTLVHMAVEMESTQVVKSLLKFRADCTVCNNDHKLPIDLLPNDTTKHDDIRSLLDQAPSKACMEL